MRLTYTHALYYLALALLTVSCGGDDRAASGDEEITTFQALKSLAGDDPLGMRASMSEFFDSLALGLEELKGEIEAAETQEERTQLQALYDMSVVHKDMLKDYGEGGEIIPEAYQADMMDRAEKYMEANQEMLEKLKAENPELAKAIEDEERDSQ